MAIKSGEKIGHKEQPAADCTIDGHEKKVCKLLLLQNNNNNP